MISESSRREIEKLVGNASRNLKTLSKQRLYKTGAEELSAEQERQDDSILAKMSKVRNELGKGLKAFGDEGTIYAALVGERVNKGFPAHMSDKEYMESIESVKEREVQARGKTHGLVPIPVAYLEEHGYDNVEEEIRDLIKALNHAGHETVASCAGHDKGFSGYVNFRVGSLQNSDKPEIEAMFGKYGINSIKWSSLNSDPIYVKFLAKGLEHKHVPEVRLYTSRKRI